MSIIFNRQHLFTFEWVDTVDRNRPSRPLEDGTGTETAIATGRGTETEKGIGTVTEGKDQGIDLEIGIEEDTRMTGTAAGDTADQGPDPDHQLKVGRRTNSPFQRDLLLQLLI